MSARMGGCDFCLQAVKVVVSDVTDAQICEACADNVIAEFLGDESHKERRAKRRKAARS